MGMFIKKLKIENFKTFKNVIIELNPEVNIFTGVNNSGKTTVLEAIALWHECFTKLLRIAKRSEKNYTKGDFVLGSSQIRYFSPTQINSIRAPNYEDIFYRRDKKNGIKLIAILVNDKNEELEMGFSINSTARLAYDITLLDYAQFDFSKFNKFFKGLAQQAISVCYAASVKTIKQNEKFETEPNIFNAVTNKESSTVLRNRLYVLYVDRRSNQFSSFLKDLNYILFDSKQSIDILTNSDNRKDTDVVFDFKIGVQDIEKDIALLGSGSLQVIEILLNLYQTEVNPCDFSMILLDEPDSYIHRDIQKRLLNVLSRLSKGAQIFMSTHNESMIRHAPLSYLFHLTFNPEFTYKNIFKTSLQKVKPRFKGLYPSFLNPIISSFGSSNGLDFINAIESDCLIFVEGEDDARAFHILLQQQINNRKKYAFWVMGGISNMFEKINGYKTIFSDIKNGDTLWDKSVLILDRDHLNDSYLQTLETKLNQQFLKTNIWNAYTFEATLMTDLPILARLLTNWLEAQKGLKAVDTQQIFENLKMNYLDIKNDLFFQYTGSTVVPTSGLISYDGKHLKEESYRFKNTREKTTLIFGKPIFTETDIDLQNLVRQHFEEVIKKQHFYKLMKKEDVEKVINQSISFLGQILNIENDFIELMECVDKSTWIAEWDFLNSL